MTLETHRPLTATVVLPTHARVAQLPRVLEAVLADPATSELVVVVDGPDPAAQTLLATLAGWDRRVRAIVQDPDQGTARAKIAGARAATSEVLVLLDDDVLAGPGLVGRHLAWHQQHCGLIVVGAMPVPGTLSRGSADALAGLVYQRNYAATCARYLSRPETILDALWGGNLSVRRSDYLSLTDELLNYPRLAHEDRHFGLVARAAGLHACYDPLAAAVHLHRRTWAGMLAESERQGRGQRALHRLHRPQVPFAADALPEPLHPLVERVVLATDTAASRRAVLALLRLAASGAMLLRREELAVRFCFAATQVARRRGRRSADVDALVLTPAPVDPS